MDAHRPRRRSRKTNRPDRTKELVVLRKEGYHRGIPVTNSSKKQSEQGTRTESGVMAPFIKKKRERKKKPLDSMELASTKDV